MKHKLFLASLTLVAMISADECKLSWSGNAGQAPKPPKITEVEKGFEEKPSIRVEVEAEGKYQGITGKFETPVDLSQYSALEFYMRQNFRKTPKNSFVVRLDMDNKRFIYRDAICGDDQWTKVTVPFEASAWQTQKGIEVAFGTAVSINIYPYSNLNTPGQFMEFAQFKLIRKEDEKSGQLSIMQYFYQNTPPAGDANCRKLTDGNLTDSALWPQYSDDPDIIFDLGGIYAVDRIRINAHSAASHNFSEMTILTGNDKKSWVPAAVIKNAGSDSEVKALEFNHDGKTLVGRYFRFKGARVRPDFPISLTEVTFYGKLPTAAEIATAAHDNYDNGPAMTERTTADYFELKSPDWRLWVHKKSGVINGIFYKGAQLAERLHNVYTLQTRERDQVIDGYQDVMISHQIKPDGVTFTVTNPQLPGIEIEKQYTLAGNTLKEKITIRNLTRKDRFFLQVGTSMVLHREFRQDGYYETLGASHTLTRSQASEIMLENMVGTIPTVIFENPVRKQTLLHYRNRFNDRFTYFDHTSDGERTTAFRPNGWFISGMTIVPADRKEQNCENHFRVTQGNLLDAYRNYIEQPEVAEYRASVKRPGWLRDAKIDAAPGWDGMWEGASERFFADYLRAFKTGYILCPAMTDLDGIWGDLPVEGEAVNWFNGRQKVERLRQKFERLKAMDPRLKFGLYTWVWSAFPYSTPAKNHPDWFIRKLRSGAPASWFPGVNVNWMRFISIPESQQEVQEQVLAMMRYYNLDIWYLDGGNTGSYAKDWETMRVDDPFGWTDLYRGIRKGIQEQSSDKIIFFNTPCDPLGDLGYLESFSGALTSEWRKGAAWMYQFKMFQYRDPLHYPAYIYWLPGVDGAYHNYLVGTGLIPSMNSRALKAADISFISARYEIRQLGLVNAGVSPDWRTDRGLELECMTMTQGNAGFVFMQQHGKDKTETIGVETAGLGLTDRTKPVYHWSFTIKDGRKANGMFGEIQLAEAYRKTGWIADRVIVPEYLGETPWRERFERQFAVNENQGKLWVMTQTPAFIWSIDSLPSQYRLPSQPGIEVSGDLSALNIKSEFEECEIAILLPDGKVPAAFTLNQSPVEYRLAGDRNLRFALVKAGKGDSTVSVTLKDAPVAGECRLTAQANRQTLSVKGVPEGMSVSIYLDGDLCFTGNGSFDLTLPDIVRDGKYTVVSGGQTTEFTVKGLAKPLRLEPILKSLPVEAVINSVNKKSGDIEVISTATAYSRNAGKAAADPDSMTVRAGTLPMYENHYNIAAAGLELKLKRFVKLELINGMKQHNLYGLRPKHHFPRHDRPDCFGGLMLDFGTPGGYTVRSAAGFGKQTEKRTSNQPEWGKKNKPDLVFVLNDALHEDKLDQWGIWVDLESLGAPMNWDGRVWMTMLLQNLGPDREFGVHVLETAAQLPAGIEAIKPLSLSKNAEPKTFKLPKGSADDLLKQPELAQLSPLAGSSGQIPTSVKAVYDADKLYLFYDCREPGGKILDCSLGKSGKPWFGDSIEFLIQLADRRDEALHVIIDADGNHFASISKLERKVGAKAQVLNPLPAEFKVDRTDRGWTMTVAIPLKVLGIAGNPQGVKLGVNLMRNRVLEGKMDYFSLVPGNTYFTGDLYKFEF